MVLPFETKYSREGKTKFVPYEGATKFRLELFREVWVKGDTNMTRGYHVLIELGENRIILSGSNIWEVLHHAGKHLALLTEPTETT